MPPPRSPTCGPGWRRGWATRPRCAGSTPSSSGAGLAREAEHPLAQDVSQDLSGAAHDRVARGVADVARHPGGERIDAGALPEGGGRAEEAGAQLGDALLELGAIGLG